MEAIVNDTVGCLCTGAYEDEDAQIGVIYGTGTNACYIEKVENIKTLTLDPKDTNQVSATRVFRGQHLSDWLMILWKQFIMVLVSSRMYKNNAASAG